MSLSKDLVPHKPHEVGPETGDGKVTIVLCPHPFSAMKHIHRVDGFGNIVRMLLDLGCKLRSGETYAVCLNGIPIPMEKWISTFPSPGQLLTVRCIPQGGGGGKGDKGPLGFIIAGLAVLTAVIAPYLIPALSGGAAFGAAAGTAASAIGASSFALSVATFGIGLVAQGLLGLIFPPPNTQLPDYGAAGRVSQLTGIRNRTNQHGTIPRVFGKHRIFPQFAAVPYTEIEGEDQYLVCLFCLGYGPLTVTELKIGDTLLSNYDDVEHFVLSNHSGTEYALSLYTADVFEDGVSVNLVEFSLDNNPSSFTVRTTTLDTVKISIDVYYPEGIIHIDGRGRPNSHTLGVNVWYRRVGTSEWLRPGVGSSDKTGETRTSQKQNISWSVPEGQYQVGVARSVVFRDADADAEERVFYSNTIQWAVLRSFKSTPPVQTTKNLVLVEMRIRATDQLNGVLDELNCIAESHLSTYDGTSWSVNKTANPAWAYTSVLLDEANARKLGTNRLDAATIKAWADWCETNNFRYNKVQDTKNTVFDQLREIAAAGRASFHILDGLYSIVREIPQTTPVQLFSPRNSYGYRGEKSFIKEHPHALRIPFVNEERGYTEDEAVVYDDGFDVSTATLFESLPFPGVTTFRQIWRQGRYFIAQARLRPEVHFIGTDIEHLTCTRGDLIEFSQDVINLGVGSARIKAVNFSGTDVESIVLDTDIPLAAGIEYGVHVRRTIGERRIVKNVEVPVNVPTTDLLTFTTAIGSSEELPEVGDLVLVGVRNAVVGRYIVRAIEHGGDLSATISLVQEAPTLQMVDIGTIPPWDPQITDLTVSESRRPPTPNIISIRSDESVLLRDTDGSLKVQIVVGLSVQTWKHSDKLLYEVRYRRSVPEGEWEPLPAIPINISALSISGVEEGVSYDISVRSVAITFGLDSPWSPFQRHRVVGKLTPPPEITSLFAERQLDGGRIISWTLDDPPLDLAGYKLRFKEQVHLSRVLSFQYRQRTAGSSSWGAWTEIPNSHLGGPNFTGFTVEGLTTGQSYEFQLRSALIGGLFSDPSGTVVITVG